MSRPTFAATSLVRCAFSCSVVAGCIALHLKSHTLAASPCMMLVAPSNVLGYCSNHTHVGRRTLSPDVDGASTIHCARLLLESYTHWPNQQIGRSRTSTTSTLVTASHWPHQHVGHRHLLVAGHPKDQMNQSLHACSTACRLISLCDARSVQHLGPFCMCTFWSTTLIFVRHAIVSLTIGSPCA
jgi:hypothetical protein